MEIVFSVKNNLLQHQLWSSKNKLYLNETAHKISGSFPMKKIMSLSMLKRPLFELEQASLVLQFLSKSVDRAFLDIA